MLQTKPPVGPTQLASLYEISKVIGSTFELKKLLNIIIDIMVQETQAETGSIMLYDDEHQVLKIAVARGLSEKIIQNTRIRSGEGIAGWVAKQKEPLLIDQDTVSRFKKTRRKGVKSSLCLPLVVSEKLIGVINVNRLTKTINFTPDDRKLFSIFANQAAIAIHNAQLYIQAEEKIQQLFKFNVISRALNSTFDITRIIAILKESVKELAGYDIYALLLIHESNFNLYLQSDQVIGPPLLRLIKKNISLIVASLTKKSARSYLRNIKTNIDTPADKGDKKLPDQINSTISAPLISKGKVIGMINLNSRQPDNFSQKHQNMLSTLANQAAIAIENANLYKNLQHTYISTIRALTAAVEAKDPYTRGHSDLVSNYAVFIARNLKLDSNMIESLHIAGILHDIGKIGIPENILCKPSNLTNEEYAVIKTHPDIAMHILEPVDFFWTKTPQDLYTELQQKQRHKNKKIIVLSKTHPELSEEIIDSVNLSQEIKKIIRHHHEQYQGKGYPDGLRGEDIPLGSRILAVADAYEAMTANRPYRKAFPKHTALKRVQDCSGTQFDPKIVEVFIRIMRGPRSNAILAEVLKNE